MGRTGIPPSNSPKRLILGRLNYIGKLKEMLYYFHIKNFDGIVFLGGKMGRFQERTWTVIIPLFFNFHIRNVFYD